MVKLKTMIPHKIGRYEIKAEIGRGGMATVYHAYDPRVQRDVALKVLPREFLHDPNFRTRFQREVQTVAALEHPAIVPIYDSGEEDGQPYLVMRFLPGGTLAQRLKRGELSFSEVIRIINRLAQALDEAHKLGIVHRDLKPDNILFDQYNEPFITDFGIAKLSEGNSTLTTSGLIIGTPAYMSPEQASGEEIDGRSDIYALGVILFQMLAGKLPYEANTPIGLIMKHMTQPVPNILRIRPDLPPGCQTVIAQALAKGREERYPTAAELAIALSDPQILAAPPVFQVQPQDGSASDHSDAGAEIICPKCQTSNTGQGRTCSNCGYRLVTNCILCYTPNRIDATHCANCGTDLKRAQLRRRASLEARRRSQAERDQAYREKEVRQLIQKLLDDLKDRKKRVAAIHQLNQLDDEIFEILIQTLLTHTAPEERCSAANMLGQICSRFEINPPLKELVIQALTQALDDAETTVSRQAQKSLQKIEEKGTNIFSGLVDWLKGS